MNYTVTAVKIIKSGPTTGLEDYEKDVLNYSEAEKEVIRLKSEGGYVNIMIIKKRKASSK
jgi:hypothetical protein